MKKAKRQRLPLSLSLSLSFFFFFLFLLVTIVTIVVSCDQVEIATSGSVALIAMTIGFSADKDRPFTEAVE